MRRPDFVALDVVVNVAMVVATLAIVVAVMVGYAHVVYGDWRCAFAECRRVIVDRDVKPGNVGEAAR